MSNWRYLLHEDFAQFADAEQAYRLITEKCQPWLQEVGVDFVVWRGISGDAARRGGSGAVQEVRVRPNRRPRDSVKRNHDAYNDRIEFEGCVANRTNSVFVTGDQREARNYGIPHAVLPVGEYHYTWSPFVRDAVSQGELIKNADHEDKVFHCDNGSITRAIKSRNEIMIACSSVILVHADIWDHVQGMLQDS